MENTIESRKVSKFRMNFKLSAVLILMFGAFNYGNAQDGAAIFKKSCAMCHTVGGGRLVGPDLKNVTTKRNEEWLLKFIKGSQAFINSGDADAKAIFDEYQMIMPDQNLPDGDIKAILTYIGSQSAEAAAPATAEAPKVEIPVTPELILKGRGLFEGSVRFSNGGAACISCHNLNYDEVITGGLLAKDLTDAYSRLGGDAGIKGILGAPPFPAMTVAYKDHPITDEEAAAVTSFLSMVDQDKAKQHPKSTTSLLFNGVIALFVIFCLIFVLWFNKKRAMVKQDIYDRQKGSIKN